ncbi:MAG: SIS domain-containing protein [Rhodospirillales bacterium]
MTFPDDKYDGIGAYSDAYFERIAKAGASVDRGKLAEAAKMMEEAYRRRATLYVCGNGGSAAIANTFVCDHAKLVQTDTDLVPRVVSLSDNISMISAIANDLSYDQVFVYQLATAAVSGDVLVTISASGDSENVVRAAQWALDNGVDVIALSGFSGGRTAAMATVSLHVEADNYGVVEDTHQSLMHILAHYIRQSRMSPELIAERKF